MAVISTAALLCWNIEPFLENLLADNDEANLVNFHKCPDIIKLDSLKCRAFTHRGRAYIFLGKKENAIQDFDKAVALRPGVYTWMERATANFELDNARRAIQDLYLVLSASPKNAEASYSLAGAMISLGKPGYAQYYCGKADRDGYQKELSLLVWFGMDMYRRDYEAAEAEMSKAITYFPAGYMWYNNRASARNYLGKYADALEDCDSCIRMAPGFAFAYNNKGLARSLQLQNNNAWAYKNRGQVWLAMRNILFVISYFNQFANVVYDNFPPICFYNTFFF